MPGLTSPYGLPCCHLPQRLFSRAQKQSAPIGALPDSARVLQSDDGGGAAAALRQSHRAYVAQKCQERLEKLSCLWLRSSLKEVLLRGMAMPMKTANRRFARIECRVLQRQQDTAPMRSAPVAGAARLGIRATAVMSCSSRAASGLTAANLRLGAHRRSAAQATIATAATF